MRLPLFTAVAAVALAATAAHASDVGRRFPPEKTSIVDRTTGVPLTVLTSGRYKDGKNYPTHPQWAHDGIHIIFPSGDRDKDGTPEAFAVNEITGDIVQLTDGPGVGTGSLNVARRSNKLYYMRRNGEAGRTQLIEVDLTPLLADSAAGKMRGQGYERIVATLPEDHIEAGGFTLDADEKTAYVGFDARRAPPRQPGQPVPQVPGGLRAIDLATGAVRTVIETPFRMGHVQANPFVPGEILYCNETGGDAPQRMWIVKADGTGNRPVFKEGPTDWVTHEQFADADHVIFNLMGHKRDLRKAATGILVVSLRDDTVEHLGQIPIKDFKRTELANFTDPNIPQDDTSTGGYWHNGVTYDGRWAAGDDFDGNVWLIDRKNNKRTLLTTGHRMRPNHTHPSFSPDGTRILIQSGMLSGGKNLGLMVVPVAPVAD
ncbi:oligogalacturonate lyase family protein [Pedomonas mirosovicensis]|uniref:oligogalacturonate lyase family protein n=1 Tax=Pedomonas mirosovicensis TaxID=2908641 RepID=UPI0021672EF4|nr:oligogalacturonate lyase family protein [Pedomonas mirosovicensis]MCH8686185.1 oligogalacturonate lyase family protein [Pedomonas mirosovicensis]